MEIDCNAFIFMLISVFVGFFFSRVVNILGYWVAKRYYNQNKDADIKGAKIGVALFGSVTLALGGILTVTNNCSILIAVILFTLAIAAFAGAISLVCQERHRIAKTEGREV
jgi:CDP-diglyceride synthetase